MNDLFECSALADVSSCDDGVEHGQACFFVGHLQLRRLCKDLCLEFMQNVELNYEY